MDDIDNAKEYSMKYDGYYRLDDMNDIVNKLEGNYDSMMEYYNNYLTDAYDLFVEFGIYTADGVYGPLYHFEGKNRSDGT